MGMNKGNSKTVKIDNIDIEILKILLADARENQKNIAERCGISPVAVLKRVKRLKETGVIAGTSLLIDEEVLDSPYAATVLIDASNTLEEEVKNKIRQIENVVVCAESIGRYNLCSLIIIYDLKELNEIIFNIKNIKGVNSVAVNIWTGKRYINFARDLKIIGG
jgi:DNA-binding Lrp family transcriptional regulator